MNEATLRRSDVMIHVGGDAPQSLVDKVLAGVVDHLPVDLDVYLKESAVITVTVTPNGSAEHHGHGRSAS